MSEMGKFLPWLMSAFTIWMTILAGNKHRSAWLIGLANQALWLTWIVLTGTWGLIPMNIALWIVYGRNHLRWSRPSICCEQMRGDMWIDGKRKPEWCPVHGPLNGEEA